MELRSWQHHVTKEGRIAWCGHFIESFEWHFVDREHAIGAVTQGSRMMPCPDCWNAMYPEEEFIPYGMSPWENDHPE